MDAPHEEMAEESYDPLVGNSPRLVKVFAVVI